MVYNEPTETKRENKIMPALNDMYHDEPLISLDSLLKVEFIVDHVDFVDPNDEALYNDEEHYFLADTTRAFRLNLSDSRAVELQKLLLESEVEAHIYYVHKESSYFLAPDTEAYIPDESLEEAFSVMGFVPPWILCVEAPRNVYLYTPEDLAPREESLHLLKEKIDATLEKLRARQWTPTLYWKSLLYGLAS